MIRLDSNKAFKNFLICIKYNGTFDYMQKNSLLYNLYRLLVFSCLTVPFPLSFMVNLKFLDDVSAILRNLSIGLNVIACSVKALIICLQQQKFINIRDTVKDLDQRLVLDEAVEEINSKITWCKWLWRGYSVVYITTVAAWAVSALITKKEMFPAYVPIDWNGSNLEFAIGFLYQLAGMTLALFQNLASDAYPAIYLRILTGHVRALRIQILHLGSQMHLSQQEIYKELVKAIQHHRAVLKYFDAIQSVISSTIFVQFVMTAILICLTVAGFLFFTQTPMEIFTSFAYLTCVIMEVSPCCYLVNEFMTEAEEITTAIFSCNWVDQNMKFKKALIIFMQSTQKKNIIVAGSLIEISLATFLGIVKLSGSMFAVLSQIEKK